MCFNINGFTVPQFITDDVTIQSNSTSCVILSWNVPKYPGGPITKYQVLKCNVYLKKAVIYLVLELLIVLFLLAGIPITYNIQALLEANAATRILYDIYKHC